MIQPGNEGAVRVLTIARPEKKNAFSFEMYEALTAALVEADRDAHVRAVMIEGAGGTFTAGNDLADFLAAPPGGFPDSPPIRLLHQLVDQAKPLVAAVDGAAIGIGTTLLLHCDLVIASTRARFQTPFVSLGLVPEGGSSVLLSRLAGLQRASAWLLLGDPFDAAAAQAAGLVNAVVAPEALRTEALARAGALAARPPEALAAAKKLLRDPLRAAAHEAIAREAEVFNQRLASAEAKAAIQAFFNRKRST